MRALVTGAGGFVGRWLVAHLEAAGDEVWTLDRGELQVAQHWSTDIRDPDGVATAIATTRPDAIYHLAGVAFGPDVRDDVAAAADITVIGTANVLRGCLGSATRPLVLVTGSSEIYASKDGPINELDPISPVSPYGYTKLAQEAVCLAYQKAGAVEVAVTRSFNHIGPGQRDSFVVSAFASQLARIAMGAPAVLKVGNLEALRDFTDVRDVVAAYRLIVAGRRVGEPLNVATGVGVRIRDLLDGLFAVAGVTADVEIDPARLRSAEAPALIGDAGRLREATGWRPEIPLDQTLSDVWRDALKRASLTAGRAP